MSAVYFGASNTSPLKLLSSTPMAQKGFREQGKLQVLGCWRRKPSKGISSLGAKQRF